MSMSNAAEAALQAHIFQNAAWAGIGDAGGLLASAAPGSLYISLHSADPGEAGNQSTSEIAYTGYARVAVSRNGSTGFTLTVSTVSNTALTQFPQCTGGSASATHFSIGSASSGAGQIIVSGALSATLSISNGIQPQFNAGDLTATAD